MNLDFNHLLELGWTQTWQLTLLAVTVGLVVRFACRQRPHLAYLLWMLVVIKALTPPVMSSPTSAFSWALAERQEVAAAPRAIEPPATKVDLALPQTDRPAMQDVRTDNESSADAPVAVEPTPGLSIAAVRVGIWLSGSAALMGFYLVRRWNLARRVAASRVEVDAALQAQFDGLVRRLGLWRKPRLLIVSEPLGPAAYGWWPGTVVLPAALVARKSPEELTPILAHELLHLRRGDTVAASVQLLAQMAWWFHPAVWWANRQARLERERACDEEVVAELACPPADYARMLVEILEWRHTLTPALPWPALGGWEMTAARLRHLVEHAQPFRRRAPLWCWLVAVAAALLVLPGAGLRQIVAAVEQETKTNEPVDDPTPTGTSKSKAPADDLQPTADEQAVIDELKTLGLEVHPRVENGKKQFYAYFDRDVPLTGKPLPLEKLAGLDSLHFNLVGDDDLLGKMLSAVKNLRPETMLQVQVNAKTGPAIGKLAEIPNLARLALIGTMPPQTADKRLIDFSKLKALKMLLYNFRGDSSFLAELDGMDQLEELMISGKFNDASLAPLAKMTDLKRLSLSGEDRQTPLEMPWIEPLVKLERLTVSQRVSDAAVARIGDLSKLELLSLEIGHLSDAGFAPVGKLTGLRSIHLFDNLRGGVLSPKGLVLLGALKELRTIMISAVTQDGNATEINDDVLLAWQGLEQLRTVYVFPAQVSERGMSAATHWPQLRALSLMGNVSATRPAQGLSAKLRELTLAAPQLSAEGIADIGHLSRLESLTLADGSSIDGAALAGLSPLTALKSLTIYKATLGGNISALADLPALRELDLSDCRLSDAALSAIGRFTDLYQLNLSRVELTDSGLEKLTGLASLDQLDLAGNPVTDAGLDHLRPLKSLRTLWLNDTKTTEAGQKRLVGAIPKLRIDTSGMRLGVFRAYDEDLGDDDAK